LQGTNKHETMPSRKQHIKILLITKLPNNIYFARKGGMLGACLRACEHWADSHLGRDMQMVPKSFVQQMYTIDQGYSYRFSGWKNRTIIIVLTKFGSSRPGNGSKSQILCLHLLNVGFLGILLTIDTCFLNTILRMIENASSLFGPVKGHAPVCSPVELWPNPGRLARERNRFPRPCCYASYSTCTRLHKQLSRGSGFKFFQ
jgi:hypothetical protein